MMEILPYLNEPISYAMPPAKRTKFRDTKPKSAPVAKRKNTRKLASQSRKRNRKRG